MRRPSYLDDDLARQTPVSRRSMLGGIGAVAALGGTVLAGYGAYHFGLLSPPPVTQRATGCLLAAKKAHATFALIDVTDPLNDIHADRLRDQLTSAANSMPDFGWLGVFVLNPDEPAASRLLFGRCAPPSPARTSVMKGGPVYLRHEWERTFEKPLLGSIEEVVASTKRAPRSPIIASIAALTQRPDFDASMSERRLILISDMLEHDPDRNGYSHLRTGDLVETYRRSVIAKTAQADLRGVRVVVDYLQRPEPEVARLQTQGHRDFWRWWFAQAGASEVTFAGVREMPGTAPARPVSDARKK